MWVLLLRAINVGGRNTLAMKDLVRVLESLGHTDVSTLLNSGNAVFRSARRSAPALAREIEAALSAELDLDLRVVVRRAADLQRALTEAPDLPGYALLGFLAEAPHPARLKDFLATDWAPDVAQGNAAVLYLGYAHGVRASRMTTARIESALGVPCTARTPATVQKLVQRAQG